MSMKDHANNILNNIQDELSAARSRKREIEKAIKILVNIGIPDDMLNPLRCELKNAEDEFVELLIHRMLVREAMRDHYWLDD